MIAATLVAVAAPPTLSGAADGPPTIASDLADYNPGGLVTLTGANWVPGNAVAIVVNDTLGQTWQHTATVTAADDGSITDVFNLPNYFVSDYDVTATDAVAGLSATTTFTDANPSADLDQCANDPAPSPNTDGCSASASDWVNGNLGASKSVYFEGDSIPYRMRFDNLSLTSHTVTIEWDTTKSSTHAIDYLTTYNRTVTTANPCLGVSGCSASTTFGIPADPQVTGAGVTPAAGNFTLFGGTITAVSTYSYHDGTGFVGDKSARITITFTPTASNPVLAWGGHIATRADWGSNNAAVAIPGSPYHTRLIDLDGSGGNQDRSLSADAVIFPGSITIIKDATPNGSTIFGFTASPAPLSSFNLVDDGTSANTKAFTNITNFQTYTVNESSIPAGWGFDSASCQVSSANGGNYTTNTTTVNVAMNEGENWTCTYLDSQRTGTLTVIKHVVNDNGGTATAGNWSLHAKSGGNEVAGSPQAGSETGTVYTLTAGAYSVSESGGPNGYTFTGFSGDCDSTGSVTVVVGQNKTCTLTNNDVAPKLHLRKLITNDNGGSAAATDFTLTATGTLAGNNVSGSTPVDSGAGLKADTWTLSETGPAGYSNAGWSCVGGTQSGSTITVGIGGEATCTITNNDIPPQLHLVKLITNDNGGTAAATDFTLTATGTLAGNNVSGTTQVDSGAGLKADTWTLSETGPAGYSNAGWSCVGGTQTGSTITVGIGGSATCTITNNDIPPQLHLRKLITNDNGGSAAATDFILTATGTLAGNNVSGPTPADSGVGLQADTWTLSETGPAGYTGSSWDCVGGTQSGNTIAVGIGGNATCTITNNDDAPGLHLRKIVVNDNGGTAVPKDFTLTADGTGGNDVSGAGEADSGPGLKADTFALSETGPGGYSASDWVCVGGNQSGSNITIALGESATCTITNNDKPPVLHLVKVVVNDNGGTAVPKDFTLTADGTGGNDVSGAGGADSGSGLKADTFALSETGPGGYSASDWVCVGGTQTGASIALGLGQEATCTITNNDKPPVLHLVKVVANDNGGTAVPKDFTLTADGTGGNDVSGAGGADSGSGLKADTFALSETGPGGYSASDWVCTGDGTQTGASIALDLGQEATCTITNNDKPPILHLVKVVKNDNGGTAVTTDFLLKADGADSNDVSGAGSANSGPGLKADTFALSEVELAGYAASGWVCTGDGTQTGASIALGLGEEATCTITNDDIAPKLHLRKVVVNDNGGTATVANFTLTANGAGTNDISGTSPVDSGSGLKADTWALSETNVYGYTASNWVCVGGTQTGSNIQVGIGDEATCTITNNDQPGTIIVQKIIKPVGSLTSFSFDANGTGYSDFSLQGGQSNTQTLNAGSYSVQELVPLGWVLTGIGGSTDPTTPYNCTITGTGGSTGVGDLNTQTATVSLKNGDTVTCVFENTGQGVTRTQGFWATHPQLAYIAWFGGTAYGHTFPGVANVAGIGDTALCGRSIDTIGKLMGGFWSDVSKTSTGAKRSALDQARMQLLQQLLAAELNASAFGSVPSGGSGMFATWESAYCGTNQNAIKNAQQGAASFNTAGDSGQFTPGTSADSKAARANADYAFWNVLP